MGVQSTLTRDQLKELGFENAPGFTVSNSLTVEIGRRRSISIGNLGTPNEMMVIMEFEKIDNPEAYPERDIVVLHNYDYDGYLTIEKVKALVEHLMCPRLKK